MGHDRLCGAAFRLAHSLREIEPPVSLWYYSQMAKLYNLARVTVASAPGTGTITLGPAVTGCLTFSASGVQNGDQVTYAISDSAQSEIGYGTWTSSSNTLTRDTVLNSTAGGGKITASALAQVFITPAAQNFLNYSELIAPLIIGGTASNSGIIFQTTTGVGSGDIFTWVGGNNGATQRMQLTSTALTLAVAANVTGGISTTGAGGAGPIITAIDSRASGATVAIAANFNGLGQPGVYSIGAFPLVLGTNTTAQFTLSTAGNINLTGALNTGGNINVNTANAIVNLQNNSTTGTASGFTFSNPGNTNLGGLYSDATSGGLILSPYNIANAITVAPTSGNVVLAGTLTLGSSLTAKSATFTSPTTFSSGTPGGNTIINFQDGTPTHTCVVTISPSLCKWSDNVSPFEFDANTNGGIAQQLLLNTDGSVTSAYSIKSLNATGGIGYGTGAGGTVTQITSRNTGVTLNKISGDIVLLAGINAAVSAATANTVVVTNSAVAITDTVIVSQKSGTDKYLIFVTNVAAGSFTITFFTTGGITNESPVFHYNVIKGVNS